MDPWVVTELNKYFFALAAISQRGRRQKNLMDKLQGFAPVGAVMDMLILKKMDEDPDLELDIKDELLDKRPLLENEQRVVHEDEDELESRWLTIDRFLNQRIDWASPYLEVDPAPFCIMEGTQMSKIHFMFSMLNIA